MLPLTHSSDILLSSEKPVERFTDLNQAEVSDLAQLTQKAMEVVMEYYKTESCQVAIQDGPAAGQTINVRAKSVYVFCI